MNTKIINLDSPVRAWHEYDKESEIVKSKV